MTKLYGWFDEPDAPPAYEPGLGLPCLHCGLPVDVNDVRTHSMMAFGSRRSFFYRTHRTCDDQAQKAGRPNMDDVVWAMIEHNRDQ